MGRRQRIDPPLSGRRRHLAPTGRSQIGDVAIARLAEGRVPFLLSKHCADGANLVAGLIMDANGNLYGPTVNGGIFGGGGTLFELMRPSSEWTEKVLYSSCSQSGCPDGSTPCGSLRGSFSSCPRDPRIECGEEIPVQSEGGILGNQGGPDGLRAGERVRRSSLRS
jgi:hypothetical protein